MPNTFINVIITYYPTIEQLRLAPALEVERMLLRAVVEYCADGMHPMVTRDTIPTLATRQQRDLAGYLAASYSSAPSEKYEILRVTMTPPSQTRW